MPKESSGRERLSEKLKDWGLEPVRMGGLEYIVATNIIIIEELQKLNGLLRNKFPKKQSKSMLDVS